MGHNFKKKLNLKITLKNLNCTVAQMGHNITEIMFKTETELQLELFPRN